MIGEGTTINAKIGDRILKPSTFPLKWNGLKVFFARYESKPRLVKLTHQQLIHFHSKALKVKLIAEFIISISIKNIK